MTTYETIDCLIVTRIKDGCNSFIFIHGGEVRTESHRISEASGKEAFRIVDARLQALRKKGLISFNSKTGWTA